MKSTKPVASTVLALVMGVSMLALPVASNAQEANQPLHLKGLSHQPSQAASDALLDPNDAVFLFLDHQTGLFQTVNDIPVAELRANTVALAKIAEQAGIPIIYTASEPDGPNGPIMEELPAAMPSAKYIARKGEVSSWDNADFYNAVKATGRKTLVISGVWTSVCVAFPALQAHADGYKVFAVMDVRPVTSARWPPMQRWRA